MRICPVDGVQEPQRERCSAHVTEVGFGREYRVASWAARVSRSTEAAW